MHDSDEYCRRCGSRVHAASTPEPTRALGSRLVDAEDDPEVVLWEGTYAIKAMFREIALTLILTILIPIFCLMAGGPAAGFALPGVILIWLLLTGLIAYRKLAVFYRISNQRLMHEQGIFYRRINRIEIIDIDDLSCEQGLIERLLGVGRIVVSSSDRTDAWLVMRGLDGVRAVCEILDNARRRERRKHGLYVESI